MSAIGVLALTVTLFAAALWDARTRTIPNALIGIGALVVVVTDTRYLPLSGVLENFASAGALLGAWLVVPTGMGAGDAKLLAVCALLGGPLVALALFFGASVGMSLYALGRWAWTRGRTRPGALPMAPFAALAWLGVLAWHATGPHGL